MSAAPNNAPNPDPGVCLKKEKADVAKRLGFRRMVNRSAIAIVLVIILCSAAWFVFGSRDNGVVEWEKLIALIFVSLSLLAIPIAYPTSDLEHQLSEIDGRISLQLITAESLEGRAEKLFDIHQQQLKKYYDQTLWHSAWIFMVGIVCLALGFAIIGVVLYSVLWSDSDVDPTEKIIATVVAGIGGLLANFIAAMYLQMHAKTVQTLAQFHHRLVGTNNLMFANYLASLVNTDDQRNAALIKIVEGIACKIDNLNMGKGERSN